jgi:hypothetical protein
MKILLFITGYRQLDEYNYFSIFLKQLNMNTICDIYIYCNNPEIESDIVKYYQKFDQKNKYLLITSLNSGYRIGGVEAVSKGIEMGIFKDYDYVIHLHPDVFITEDAKLMEILTENLENDIVFFITESLPYDPRFFSFDFFITKTRSETMNTSKPNTTIETTSKNKGQRTSNKNKERYQTPNKKHDFKEQDKT